MFIRYKTTRDQEMLEPNENVEKGRIVIFLVIFLSGTRVRYNARDEEAS